LKLACQRAACLQANTAISLNQLRAGARADSTDRVRTVVPAKAGIHAELSAEAKPASKKILHRPNFVGKSVLQLSENIARNLRTQYAHDYLKQRCRPKRCVGAPSRKRCIWIGCGRCHEGSLMHQAWSVTV